MTDRLAASWTDFIELMGLTMEAEGLPRIAGRIVGLLLFDDRPISFGELATELQVSRGSISSNTRLLVDRGHIERCTRPGDRQDYFRITDDHVEHQLHDVSRRLRKTSVAIQQIMADLPEDAQGVRGRLGRHAKFYAAIADGIQGATEQVRAQRDETT